MKEKNQNSGLSDKPIGSKEKNELQGYPLYPDKEDIYNKYQKLIEINPEDITTKKETDINVKINKSKDFVEDLTGGDLDIPGAELDDEQEIIGSEDEENNYYSLGGEDHLDLEEDKGE